MADLLIKAFVTLDKGPAVVGRVFLAQVADQRLQDWGVPYGVGMSHSILQSPEQSCIGLAVLSRGCRGLVVVTLIEGELYVNAVVAFGPAGPEFCVFPSVFG